MLELVRGQLWSDAKKHFVFDEIAFSHLWCARMHRRWHVMQNSKARSEYVYCARCERPVVRKKQAAG